MIVESWEVILARLGMFTLGFIAAQGVLNFDITVSLFNNNYF